MVSEISIGELLGKAVELTGARVAWGGTAAVGGPMLLPTAAGPTAAVGATFAMWVTVLIFSFWNGYGVPGAGLVEAASSQLERRR